MNAQDINAVLRVAREARRQCETASPDEFVKLNVGPFLEVAIGKLKALNIPVTMKYEGIQREAEIGACEDCIRRWLKARGQTNVVQPVTRPDLIFPTGRLVFEGLKRPDPEPRMYTRDGQTVFRVYDGGKKS